MDDNRRGHDRAHGHGHGCGHGHDLGPDPGYNHRHKWLLPGLKPLQAGWKRSQPPT